MCLPFSRGLWGVVIRGSAPFYGRTASCACVCVTRAATVIKPVLLRWPGDRDLSSGQNLGGAAPDDHTAKLATGLHKLKQRKTCRGQDLAAFAARRHEPRIVTSWWCCSWVTRWRAKGAVDLPQPVSKLPHSGPQPACHHVDQICASPLADRGRGRGTWTSGPYIGPRWSTTSPTCFGPPVGPRCSALVRLCL